MTNAYTYSYLETPTHCDGEGGGLTPKQRWERIEKFKFPQLFFELLCQKQQWDEPFALEAVEEYKRFIYLATYSSVTPSVIIDEVWHLHIQWTSLYAEFCKDLFSDDFCHHFPEFLPPIDGVSSFHEQYYETLKLYYWEFDCHPPRSIWSYGLRDGVKLRLKGRVVPISAEPFWRALRVVFSPAFRGGVLKARTSHYASSHLIPNSEVSEAKVLGWKFPEGFEDRLAREQGWSKAFASEATSEYLKFHVLKLRGVESVSPVLEQVWLLHLLATQNYLEFSRTMGSKVIPHVPGKSILLEWSDLVSEYQNAFLSVPPSTIWKV